jgi:hypothetical protein
MFSVKSKLETLNEAKKNFDAIGIPQFMTDEKLRVRMKVLSTLFSECPTIS